MKQIHIDRAIEQAAAWNYGYVVVFGREDGQSEDLEFLERFRTDVDMEMAKNTWEFGHNPPYQVRQVFDVNYWIDKG